MDQEEPQGSTVFVLDSDHWLDEYLSEVESSNARISKKKKRNKHIKKKRKGNRNTYAVLYESERSYEFTNLIVVETQDSTYSYQIEYLSDKSWYDKNGLDMFTFTGTINTYDLEGNLFNSVCMEGGFTCKDENENGRLSDVVCSYVLYQVTYTLDGVVIASYLELELGNCNIVSEPGGGTGSGSSGNEINLDDPNRPLVDCVYDENYDCESANSIPVNTAHHAILLDPEEDDRVQNPCEIFLLAQPLGLYAGARVAILASEARTKTAQLFGGNFADDCSDAFRHAYWNALMAFELNATNAKTFADAHECNGTTLSHQMDYHNNQVGRNIGASQTNRDQLASHVMLALNNGQLQYLSRGLKSTFTGC